MVESQSVIGRQFVMLKNLITAGQGPPILAHLTQELAKASPTNEIESIRGHFKMFVSSKFIVN